MLFILFFTIHLQPLLYVWIKAHMCRKHYVVIRSQIWNAMVICCHYTNYESWIKYHHVCYIFTIQKYSDGAYLPQRSPHPPVCGATYLRLLFASTPLSHSVSDQLSIGSRIQRHRPRFVYLKISLKFPSKRVCVREQMTANCWNNHLLFKSKPCRSNNWIYYSFYCILPDLQYETSSRNYHRFFFTKWTIKTLKRKESVFVINIHTVCYFFLVMQRKFRDCSYHSRHTWYWFFFSFCFVYVCARVRSSNFFFELVTYSLKSAIDFWYGWWLWT